MTLTRNAWVYFAWVLEPLLQEVGGLFTPRVSDGCNSFDIVCLCVCVCLSVTTLTGERTDIWTWFFVCRSSGRISRSNLKVKVIGQGQGHQVKKCNEEVIKTPEVILVKFHIKGDRHSYVDGAAQRSRQQDHLLSLRSGHAFDTIYEWSGYDAGCFQRICGFFLYG